MPKPALELLIQEFFDDEITFEDFSERYRPLILEQYSSISEEKELREMLEAEITNVKQTKESLSEINEIGKTALESMNHSLGELSKNVVGYDITPFLNDERFKRLGNEDKEIILKQLNLFSLNLKNSDQQTQYINSLQAVLSNFNEINVYNQNPHWISKDREVVQSIINSPQHVDLQIRFLHTFFLLQQRIFSKNQSLVDRVREDIHSVILTASTQLENKHAFNLLINQLDLHVSSEEIMQHITQHLAPQSFPANNHSNNAPPSPCRNVAPAVPSLPNDLATTDNFTHNSPSINAGSAFPTLLYTPTLFSQDKAYYNKKALIEVGISVTTGLISVPLFFIEPITATILAIAAVLLVADAIRNFYKAGKCENVAEIN